MRVLPVTRRCMVRSGRITTSSWSLPIAPWPFAASVPTTVHENCLTRSGWPSASALPYSSRRTVAPTRQTAAPARSSSSSKRRPEARRQLLVSK